MPCSHKTEMLGYLGSYILFSLAVGAFEIYLDIRQRVKLNQVRAHWPATSCTRRRGRSGDPGPSVTRTIGAPGL